MRDDGSAFAGVRLGRPLWPHQQLALAAFDRARAAGSKSTYLVIPPGGGKTMIVGRLTDPHVIGLTATPPHMMTTGQKTLHDELFGAVDLEVSAPGLVRDGHLAPYQELAYFTTPMPAEAEYIHGEAVRFAELRAGLLDPVFAATPFLDWLQRRIVDRREDGSGAQVSWERFERDEPGRQRGDRPDRRDHAHLRGAGPGPRPAL